MLVKELGRKLYSPKLVSNFPFLLFYLWDDSLSSMFCVSAKVGYLYHPSWAIPNQQLQHQSSVCVVTFNSLLCLPGKDWAFPTADGEGCLSWWTFWGAECARSVCASHKQLPIPFVLCYPHLSTEAWAARWFCTLTECSVTLLEVHKP